VVHRESDGWHADSSTDAEGKRIRSHRRIVGDQSEGGFSLCSRGLVLLQIRQGTTAILILKIDHDVYVLNCGTSMALAITGDPSYPVIKLNEFLHDIDNPEEANRLSDLGVKPSVGNLARDICFKLHHLRLCSVLQEPSATSTDPSITTRTSTWSTPRPHQSSVSPTFITMWSKISGRVWWSYQTVWCRIWRSSTSRIFRCRFSLKK